MRGHPTLTLVTPENRIYAKKIQKPRALFSFRRMETFSTQKGELEKKSLLKGALSTIFSVVRAVFRMPIKANPRSKVHQGFHLAS